MKKKLNIVVFGDSLVSCLELKKNNRWLQILKNKFKFEFNFSIFSINGATTNDAINKIDLIFKIKKIDILIFAFGTNDSVFYMSMKGKPRVSLKIFRKNFLKLAKKIIKRYNSQIVFLTAHKFLRKRLEGNRQTHNYSYKKYRKEIFKIAKLCEGKVVDIYGELTKYPAKKYCLPLPDGLHLNDYGSLLYSKILSKFLINKVIKRHI